jgi:hypothetical protein
MARPKKFKHLSKKEKKKLLYKTNRIQQELFQMLRLRRAEEARMARSKEDEQKKRLRRGDKKSQKKWSDKVSKVRNKLTGKKRLSKERWNRFAGTGGEGGRGL